MNTITNMFQQAQLAEAAYADFASGLSTKDALVAKEFSAAKTADFVTHWRVANHLPDTGSGFSATVFRID